MFNFKSVYAGQMREFVEHKRKLGFAYRLPSSLNQIDDLAHRRNETGPGVSREFASEWALKRSNEANLTHHGRVSMMIHFSLFLVDNGIESFVPTLPKYNSTTYIPYIFSHDELDKIFSAVDNLILELDDNNSVLFGVPALIRVLAATGLRISEAIALKDDEVDLKNNWLRVRESKNAKERIIPISESLVAVLKTYCEYRDQVIRGSRAKYFFLRPNGRKLEHNGARIWFREALKLAGIPKNVYGREARIHDLRHTFAVSALRRMVSEGQDSYVALPILSCYLGHDSLRSTEYYVKLTVYSFPDLADKMAALCIDLFPKLNSPNDEEEAN